jgi:hypothetical protein
MEYIPCRERTFPFEIQVDSFYESYLRWLRYLCERFGPENALALWEKAFTDYDDTLTKNILTSGWNTAIPDESQHAEARINELLTEFFPTPYSILSIDKARTIIENTPPIFQIKQFFSLKKMWKEISAYNALQLRYDGFALIAESLIEKYGKQGELIVYDLNVDGRIASGSGPTGSVEEFISGFITGLETDMEWTATLEVEFVSKSTREAVLFIKECEWARYFQERHPQVAYIMACSTDEAAYKAFNKTLRLQRTTTLLVGGKSCDFRVYALDETTNSS